MRQPYLCKTLESAGITEDQMDKINRYSRRPLSREEVYAFTVVLCDNEVDRDLERFPLASLETLAELYLGRTGVFDHAPTAENQSARIFDTALERTEERNSVGEPYALLKAWAYMVRCDKNADLILEIEAGIKKEVSVGCAVERILCSVCREDQKGAGCEHVKGECYDGRLCHHLLVDPTDAYEWSFVAVPAQKRAGVVKRRGGDGPASEAGGVCVEKARLEKLERMAVLGERCEAELRERVVRLGLLGYADLDAGTLGEIAAKLDAAELRALEKSFAAQARRHYPVAPQLARTGDADGGGAAFKI